MSLTNFQTTLNTGIIKYKTGTIGHIVPVNNKLYATVLMDDKWIEDPWSTPTVYFNQHSSANYEESLLEELLIPLKQENTELMDLALLQNQPVTVQLLVNSEEGIEVGLSATLADKPIMTVEEQLWIRRALNYGGGNVEYLSEEHLARIVQMRR